MISLFVNVIILPIFAKKDVYGDPAHTNRPEAAPGADGPCRRNARKQKRSFNSYVEHVLELATGPDFPVLPPKYVVSGEIRDLHRIAYKVPTAQELADDPKLAYLWEKYGRD